MALTMKDWMTSAALDELVNAFETLKPEYSAGETLRKYPYNCSPVSLTVHLQKRRHVQLIEFNGSCGPLDVTISDGTTKIRATFTADCALSLGHSQDAVQKTIGAVLGISDYYLVYNPSSPLFERLTLRITKFKIIGSEGERVFGKPVEIENRESLWGIFSQLDDLLCDSQAQSATGLNGELDIKSQASDIDDQEGSTFTASATQTAFATQVPREKTEDNFQYAGDVLELPAVGKGTALLALLIPKDKASGNGSVGDMTDSGPRTKRTAIAQITSVLQPVSEGQKAVMSSRLDSKANSESSSTSSSSKEYALPQKESKPPAPLDLIPNNESENENSQESLNKRLSRTTPSHQRSGSIPDVDQRRLADMFMAPNSDGNPFEGMKRVPRRYVRIPPNQKALLESENFWWQPESDSRAAHAKLPPEVVRDLDNFIAGHQQGRKAKESSPQMSDIEGGEYIEDEEVERDGSMIYEAEKDRCKPGKTKEDEGDESTGDHESVISSWSVSQYSTREAAVESPNDNFNHDIEMADVIATSKAEDLSSIALEKLVPSNLKRKIDYSFPSSDPGDEDELELAVPYAIDDPVDDSNSKIAVDPETYEEVPSTALSIQQEIQVQQTPDHNGFRGTRDFANQTDQGYHRRGVFDPRPADSHIPLDLVIPATIHDSPQYLLSYSKEGHANHSRLSHRVPFISEASQSGLQEDDLVVQCLGVVEKEDEKVHEQLFTELMSSQHEKTEGIAFSPSLPSRRSNSTSPVHDAPGENAAPSNGSSLIPQEQGASVVHTAPLEVSSESGDTPSSPAQTNSLPEIQHPQVEVQKLKRPRNTRSLPGPSQGNDDFKDVEAWAKANANLFVNGPSPVQIAQPQPSAPAKELESQTQLLVKEVFLQSSNNFIHSSIPESESELVTTDKQLEVLRAIDHEEPLITTILNEARPSHNTNYKDSSIPLNISTLETASFADDLKTPVIVQSTRNLAEGGLLGEKNNNPLSISSESDAIAIHGEESWEEVVVEEKAAAKDAEMRDGPGQPDEEIFAGSMRIQEGGGHPRKPSAFDKFKSIYPSYSGTEKNFIWALVYIEWLIETKGEYFLRASLWDDFIRTLADEFLEYVQKAKYSKERTRTGFEYFNKLDKTPIFQERFMTPDNLHESVLTLDPAKVEKVRVLFNKTAPPLKDLSRSQSSYTSFSEAAKKPTPNQTHCLESSLADTTQISSTKRIFGPGSFKSPERTSVKRPFFETASQLHAGKKARTSAHPMHSEGDREVPRTPKARKSLPWAGPSGANASPRSNTKSISSDRPAISRLPTSNRNDTRIDLQHPVSPILGDPEPRSRLLDVRDVRSKSKQKSTTTSTTCGSPDSPILGVSEPISHSFDASDIRAGSLSSSTQFRKSRTKGLGAALRQPRAVARAETGKVEGWLDDAEAGISDDLAATFAVPQKMPRSDPEKNKQEGRLKLLNIHPSSSEVTTSHVAVSASRTVASSSDSRASGVVSVSAQKGRFREYLRKKRESLGLAPSTLDSKASECKYE